MATSQSNNNLDPKSNVSGDLKASIESLKQFSNVTQSQKDTVRDVSTYLKSMERSYERLNAKADSYNKSIVNTKRLERDLEVSIQNQIISKNKLTDAIAKTGGMSTQYNKDLNTEIKLQERIKSGLLNQNQLRNARNYLTMLSQDLEYQTYKASVEAAKRAELEVDSMRDRLDIEKEVAKQVGFTGRLLNISNKYLGIGGGLYTKIVEEARKGESTTKNWIKGTGILVGLLVAAKKGLEKTISGISGLAGNGGGPISKLVAPVSNLVKGIPIIGGLLGGVVDLFANLADFATESASAVKLFGRNLGLSEIEASKINNQFSNIAHNSGNLLFNSRKFREVQTEISSATGLNNILTAEQLKTQIQLKELAGVDLDTRKELLEVSRISGVEQSKIMKTIMGQNSVINKTLGISFQWQKTLKEASSLGGVLGLSFAKYPEKLTKSLMTVKSMGMELKQIDSIADSFLEFESSISKEFEAQLLTGKDINLTKAREAFLNNDLATAATEITKQIGTSADYLNMNRIQQDAISASMGMNRDSMAEMLKQQENFSKLNVSDLKTYQQKTAELSRTIEGRKELVKTLGEEQAQVVMSQTATEKIANFIDKIKTSFADLLSQPGFTKFVDSIIEWISSPDKIKSFLGGITNFISYIIKAIAAVVNVFDYMSFGSIDNKIIDNLNNYASQAGSLSLGSLSASTVAGSKSSSGLASGISSAGKSGESKVYVMVMVDPVTGKSVEKVVSQQYFETHGGQLGR
jgi:hypothetical protein